MQRVQRCAALQGLVAQLLRQPQCSSALLQQLPCLLADERGQPGLSGRFTVWPHATACRQFANPSNFKAALVTARPQSLAVPKDIGDLPDDNSIGRWRRLLLRIGGFYSRQSGMQRGAKALYQTIVEQAEDRELREALGLEDRFMSTYSLQCLHVWMILVRLRTEGDDGKDLAQIMYEDFTDDVEIRVHKEGVKVRVNKWLKELEKIFYGTCQSYERALAGETDLVDALQRNVYGDDPTQRAHAVTLSQYIRRELDCLKLTPTEDVMKGKIMFSRLHHPVPPTKLSKPKTH